MPLYNYISQSEILKNIVNLFLLISEHDMRVPAFRYYVGLLSVLHIINNNFKKLLYYLHYECFVKQSLVINPGRTFYFRCIDWSTFVVKHGFWLVDVIQVAFVIFSILVQRYIFVNEIRVLFSLNCIWIVLKTRNFTS